MTIRTVRPGYRMMLSMVISIMRRARKIITNSPSSSTNPPLATIASSMGHYAAADHPGARPGVIGGGADWGIFKRRFWGVSLRYRQSG